ncbi:AMP-dependent synthetase/ligase [Zongyangia hominis]|uniref:AMP-binding protein n=1 Tax=Zongyangia hominis TaxID=2763677 RepID=A0A926EBX0_9FIRM|nr:AMP-binding protein [Zongyangia hominis]MBC8569286.1 AMP-binding protein [Zongyangia hominis]
MKKFHLNQVDYYETFPAFLEGIRNRFGEKPALSYFTRKKEEVRHSYTELVRDVHALCEALCAMDLDGQHVALVGENSYEWIVAYLAITATGGVAVCIDIEQPDESIRQMLITAGVKAAFVSETYLPICKPLIKEDACLRQLMLMAVPEGDGQFPSLTELCAIGREKEAGENSLRGRVQVDPDQTAAIVFTSGTTSRPKLVMLTQKNILQNTSDAILYISAEEKVFTSLPFYHTYGMTCAVLGTLVRGAHLYLNGDLKTMMRDLHLAQPDSIVTVPLIVEAIYNQIWLGAEKQGKARQLRRLLKINGLVRRLGIPWQSKTLLGIREKIVGNLHIAVSGGAHLSKEITKDMALFGIFILQGYGITECSPLVSVNCNYSYRMGSVGHVLPSCQLKMVDGEIWVKGPSVMKGYYRDDEATKQVLEDGWFKTGDLGYQDKDGFLFLTGRKKNLIVFKNGKKLSPEKIEEMIGRIPLVKDVLIHGIKSGNSADDVKVAASIYPDPERARQMSSYEILEELQKEIDRINATLPLYQQVQMINIREKEFAKTASQKIKRHMV